MNSLDLGQFIDKIKKAEKGNLVDLSIGEDLSIGIMNLISIEEHLLFTGNKTGDTKYFDLINEIRKMRVELLKQIVQDPKGEIWCISKHLLATSMRLFEVGTKHQTKGDQKTAYDFFQKSFNLYNLFWSLNLGIVKDTPVAACSINKSPKPQENTNEKELNLKKSDLFGKLNNVVGKVLNCCKE